MTAAATNKQYGPLIEELTDQGWCVEKTKNQHWKATPPPGTRGEIVIFSESYDNHAYLNTVRKLRDLGLRWPPPSKAEKAAERRRREAEATHTTEAEPVIRSTPFPPEKMDMPEPKLHLVAKSPDELPGPDKLFADLKEAREYAKLAAADLAERKQAVDEAAAAYDIAFRAHADAVDHLRAKKSAFDRAFEAP